MLDHEGGAHLYIQISDLIRKRISSGGIPSGQALSSEAELCDEFGVARTTARRAIRILRDEGLVYVAQGEGTFVGPPGRARHRNGPVPMYREIANDLVRSIVLGDLRPRRPLPSETALVQRHGVARMTVRHAIRILREEGWVYTVPQRGSYVSTPEQWPGETGREAR
ncbi:winged helix-turn-helix domain-containing protein [Planobispora rosea]|uniref:GntR family transcriptional regulator n=1 Tax=Planobispora rosea TaxID=35762 RepID=UPI00083B4E08|nr:winged helix-turn-helix domain-containing protein [Planobispora rosea]